MASDGDDEDGDDGEGEAVEEVVDTKIIVPQNDGYIQQQDADQEDENMYTIRKPDADELELQSEGNNRQDVVGVEGKTQNADGDDGDNVK